jgi:phosphoribosylglycinamide formyltransferase 1
MDGLGMLVSPDVETIAQTLAQRSARREPLPKLRLGIMASGSGSNFEAIAAAIDSGALNAEIALLIYNNPDAKVLERSQRLGVPAVLLNHREYATREALDQTIVEVLRSYQIEWVIMAGWMRIVTAVLIDAFPKRILNIHPSLLPSFKGGKAIEQAFSSGVKITGCTVHYVVPEVDSGAILMQSAVPILPEDQLSDLQQRIQRQEHVIYPVAISLAAYAEQYPDRDDSIEALKVKN